MKLSDLRLPDLFYISNFLSHIPLAELPIEPGMESLS